MALKPNTIKALFGNLKMDSLDPVLKSQILQDTAEDTTRLLKYMDSQAQYGQYPYHKFQTNPAIRNALQARTGYVGDIPVVRSPAGGVINDAANFIFANDNPSTTVNLFELHKALDNAADAAPELNNLGEFIDNAFYSDPFIMPSLSDDTIQQYNGGLVASPFGHHSYTVEPHENNKKLHQWYEAAKAKAEHAQQINRWNVPEASDYPIDYLPF